MGTLLTELKLIVAARVFESPAPSFTVTLKAGANSLPSSTNCTRLPLRFALVKVAMDTPSALLSWKKPPLTALTV